MLKITRDSLGGRPRLRVEGRLAGPWVEELRSLLGRPAGGILLDLGAVTYVDRGGERLLRALLGREDVKVTASSTFVSELLRGGEKPSP